MAPLLLASPEGVAQGEDSERELVPADAGYALVAVDGAGDGVGAGDPLFVHFGPAAVLGPSDVRLTASGCCGPGVMVLDGDDEVGQAFVRLETGAVAYAERDGFYGASLGDPLYLDLDSSATASRGDLDLLTGVRLAGGGPADGRPLAAVEDGTLRLKHVDLDGDFYFDAADALLLDVTRAAYPAPSDVLLTAGPAGAFGTRLTVGSPLAVPTTRTSFLQQARVGYVDYGFDGPTADDGFYLAFDRRGNVSEGAVRLVATLGHPAGSTVGASDEERTPPRPLLPLPGALARARNSAVRYEFESDLYLDVDTSGAVSERDFRFSMGPFAGFLAATLVQAGDADIGRTLDRLGASLALKYVDAAGNRFYDSDDPLYLDMTGRAVPALGDVRVSVPGFAFGTRVLEGDPDHVATTRGDIAAEPRLMFWDVQAANGKLDAREPVFAHLGNGNESQAGDVRLADVADGGLAGTRVRGGDDDENAPLIGIPYALAYREADGHPGFSAGRADVLYLDFAPRGRVSDGDVRLTDARNETQPLLGPGSRVTAGAPDLGRTLQRLVTERLPLKYLDRNANGRFDSDATYPDVLYLDFSGADVPAPGDVRLTPVELRGAASAFGSKVSVAEADATTPGVTHILTQPPTTLPVANPESEPEDELARLRRELAEAEQDRTLTDAELDALRARIAELEAERAEERRQARQWGPAAFALFGLGLALLGASVVYFVRRRADAERRSKRGGGGESGLERD